MPDSDSEPEQRTTVTPVRSPAKSPSDTASGEETGTWSGPSSTGGAAHPFAPAVDPAEIGRFGKYRIQKKLGEGGMGAVYLAFDERLRRRVALKVMHTRDKRNALDKERFLREARAAAQISSDHVVSIYETEEIDGIPYIALQLLQGLPLDEQLRTAEQPTIRESIRIIAETARGLATAHELGLVHRDIKPANLWLEAPAGRVKILDFGLAKPVVGADLAELTPTGAVMGTPNYMAPEQGMGKPVDGRADLFSLGCVLYRLCTGQLPFPRATLPAILIAIAMEEPEPVRDLNPAVPESLAGLIRRLMAKKPEDRPATATAVVAELERILASEQFETQTAPEPAPPKGSPTENEATITRIAPARADTVPLPPPGSAAPGHPEHIGRFEIRGTLGAGAFAIVYRGFDPHLRREVAIKVPKNPHMSAEQIQAFQREAHAAAGIRHQNVCPVYEIGVEGGRPFIVMHLARSTLANVIAGRKTPFPPRDSAAIVRKLALGVAAAHALNVSHRDLKPANVLVDDDREVLIADFGLAILSDETRVSIEGSVKGTPAYMAPEQADGDIEAIGPLSDIHALGVIFYELMTGTIPFRGTSVDVVLSQVRSRMPRPPSDIRAGIDPVLDAICLKAMAKKPADRYASAKDFVNALTDYLRKPVQPPVKKIEVVKPPPPSPPPPSPPPMQEFVEILDTEPPVDAEELPERITREEMQLLDAVTAGDRVRIKRLVGSGVNINARCDQGASVLYYACLSADDRLVKLLLELGADPNLTAEGEAIAVYAPKPLDLVMQAMVLTDWTRYRPILDLLLKRGATDWQGGSPSRSNFAARQRAEERDRNRLPGDKSSWWQFWK